MNGSEMPAGGLAKLETMERRLQAVYKHGALYPLEPLQLQDMQEATLTITDTSAIDEDLAGYFAPEEWLEAEIVIGSPIRKLPASAASFRVKPKSFRSITLTLNSIRRATPRMVSSRVR